MDVRAALDKPRYWAQCRQSILVAIWPSGDYLHSAPQQASPPPASALGFPGDAANKKSRDVFETASLSVTASGPVVVGGLPDRWGEANMFAFGLDGRSLGEAPPGSRLSTRKVGGGALPPFSPSRQSWSDFCC